MDNNNQDLAKQYQDILDHYSKELSGNQEPVIPSTSDSVDTPKVSTPVEVAPPSLDVPEALKLPPVTPPPVKNYTISTPPSPPVSTKPSNVFKYLFFLSLLIFLGILGAIVYTVLFANKNSTTVDGTTPTPIEDVLVSPTSQPQDVCEVNDKTYPKGESFAAADGCNTCTCGADLTISCTEMSCNATPTTKPNTTPTVSHSIYTNSTYKYSFEYPSAWTLTIDANTKDREFSFSLPNNEKVNGVVFASTGATNRSQSTLKEFTLANNYQLLVTYISGDELKSIPGSKDLPGFKKFLSSFKLF